MPAFIVRFPATALRGLSGGCVSAFVTDPRYCYQTTGVTGGCRALNYFLSFFISRGGVEMGRGYTY